MTPGMVCLAQENAFKHKSPALLCHGSVLSEGRRQCQSELLQLNKSSSKLQTGCLFLAYMVLSWPLLITAGISLSPSPVSLTSSTDTGIERSVHPPPGIHSAIPHGPSWK